MFEEFNLVLALFLFFLFLMVVMGIPCVLGHDWVPEFIKELFPYGKNYSKPITNRLIKATLVPKSWFSHFYIFAVIYTAVIVVVIASKYFLHMEIPGVQSYLNTVAFHRGKALSEPNSALLAAFLFLVQVSRRLYESLKVNVFSSAKMNLIHYCSGIAHYWGCATVLLAYAPGFAQLGVKMHPVLTGLKYHHLVGIAVFLFGWYNQYQAHAKLASFRKDPRQKEQYFIAHGGLFEYVSCPNFLCEVLVYFGILIVLGAAHYMWTLVTIWVMINQTLAAVMAHRWYHQKFKDYPKKRKAIFPFVF